eukprot:977770-Rhodomonas_salina.1
MDTGILDFSVSTLADSVSLWCRGGVIEDEERRYSGNGSNTISSGLWENQCQWERLSGQLAAGDSETLGLERDSVTRRGRATLGHGLAGPGGKGPASLRSGCQSLDSD